MNRNKIGPTESLMNRAPIPAQKPPVPMSFGSPDGPITPVRKPEVNNLMSSDGSETPLPARKPKRSKSSEIADDSFNSAMSHVFKVEGGEANDRAGATMKGITWKYNKDILNKLGYTKETLKDITKGHADEVYKKNYWDKSKAPSLPKKAAGEYFNIYVNNPSRANKALASTKKELSPDDNGFSKLYKYHAAKDYIEKGDFADNELNGVLNRYLGVSDFGNSKVNLKGKTRQELVAAISKYKPSKST